MKMGCRERSPGRADEKKKRKQKKMMVGIAIVAAVGVLIYLLINLQTYTKVRISDTYVERAHRTIIMYSFRTVY